MSNCVHTVLKGLAVAAIVAGASGPARAADCFVGIAMYTLDAPYFAAQEQAARQRATELGCKVTSSDGQNDMMKQIADVEDMVARGINVLILNPRDPKGLVPTVNATTAAGVKVVGMDNGLDPSANFITLVQSSNQLNGEAVGDWLAHQMAGKHMKIALISGQQGGMVSMERRLGALAGLIEAQLRMSGQAGFEIVGQGWGSWSHEGGVKAMEDLLTAHPDINVVLGENDSMVLGARRVLEDAKHLDGVLLVAVADGQKEALELIKKGQYGATGLNDPVLIARTAVEVGVQALQGKLDPKFPKLDLTTPMAITKDNVDKYYKPDAVF
jgi:ribose transport system substrate-binding protein